MPIMRKDRRLAEMILFVSERSEGDERFGAVKLNKLLFFSDFLAYLYFGNPVTGQEYQMLENGPAPRRLVPVRRTLIEDGELAMRKVEYFNYHQERTFALREPDLELFTAKQIAIVTKLILDNWGRNAKEMSDMSHQFHGWDDAGIGETIPYELALLDRRKPTAAESTRMQADVTKAAEFLSGVAVTQDA